jgi:hypothetical protein
VERKFIRDGANTTETFVSQRSYRTEVLSLSRVNSAETCGGMALAPPPAAPMPSLPLADGQGIGGMIIAVLLSLLAAMGLALAMVVQRYALAFPKPRVPLVCVTLPRGAAWAVGLVLYIISNVIYGAALGMAPLSLCGSIFTLLLVFNMLFARVLLGERLTRPKIQGAMVIFLGVCTTAVSTPAGAKGDFTPEEVGALFSASTGAIYLLCILVAVLASVVAILWFERRYPPVIPVDEPEKEGQLISRALPPAWLDALMGLVYPASLGMDEAFTQVLRARRAPTRLSPALSQRSHR